MSPSSFGMAVSSPEAVLDSKPDEETILWRAPRLPNDVAERARKGRYELGFVGGAG
jgi:hypothetical protein